MCLIGLEVDGKNPREREREREREGGGGGGFFYWHKVKILLTNSFSSILDTINLKVLSKRAGINIFKRRCIKHYEDKDLSNL